MVCRASTTDRSIAASLLRPSPSSRAISTASDSKSAPSERRPFVRSVLPLETRSTIASARPSRGAISTEPVTSTSSGCYSPFEQDLAGEVWVGGRDVQAGELLHRRDRRLLGHRRFEAAPAEAEPQEFGHVRAALAHEVGAGDPAVDDAVLHVLGDVRGAHEQHVDRRVAARERERALARLLRARDPASASSETDGSRNRPFAGSAIVRRSLCGAVDDRAAGDSRLRRGAASAPRASPSSSRRASAG